MRLLSPFFILFLALSACVQAVSMTPALRSFETDYTLLKVRDAKAKGKSFIVAASYEGTVIALNYKGRTMWENPLSGYMVHDLWCDDLNGDGDDEILVANADGSIYCLSAKGETLWTFRPNEGGHLPPMYAVCTIHDASGKAYVVCGGFDMSFYYLSAAGERLKQVKSSTYSTMKAWGKGANAAPTGCHNVNFLRPMRQADGSEVLLVHASNNHMQSTGALYQFEPLAQEPTVLSQKVKALASIGDMYVCDPDGDGQQEILFGTSKIGSEGISRFDPVSGETEVYGLKRIGNAGYRVTQVTTIPEGDSFRYLMLSGNYIVMVNPNLDPKSEEKIYGTYAFYDMWKDAAGHILLASSQSGGSALHVIDPTQSNWKEAFTQLNPPGKIQTILANTQACRDSLEAYQQPVWQRDTQPVYLTWAQRSGREPTDLVKRVSESSDSPVFLHSIGTDKENWDRSNLGSALYEKKRDRRMKYTLTQQQVLDKLVPAYEGAPGIAYWVGHGNDPYMYQLDTTKKVLDAANGKKTVLILPELADTRGEGAFVIHDLFNPMAEYAAEKNANIIFRSKNIFWQGDVYMPEWRNIVSGRFAQSVVPSMEETTDKTMELSLVGRLGLWASGAVDAWGMRCSRDNPSFDRSRQHSYQRLPNHFLRTFVYSLACGSTYINNTYVDQDHMGLAWELVAKGALFVPKRDEIVSFNPVHLSMKEPDEHYLLEGISHKWTTYYDREFEENNPMVFARKNATWMAAPNTDWDFSRYAAGVSERRHNFIPPYPHGTVLITPPQAGVFADQDAPRGQMVDHLHPIYKGILKEYITDGRHYLSADGKQTFAADTSYKQVAADIETGAKQLPLSVSGDVAWVVAQVSPKHLRLTLVDSGYLNPSDKQAKVQFHTIQPVKVSDTLTGESFESDAQSSIEVAVPCGLFRFIDIELSEPLS